MILLRKRALQVGSLYVFEPNGPAFARLVQRGFEDMLGHLYERGAFAGPTAAASYQVIVDEALNTQQLRDRGQFIVELRVAPSWPLAFLRVRLLQHGDHLSATKRREMTNPLFDLHALSVYGLQLRRRDPRARRRADGVQRGVRGMRRPRDDRRGQNDSRRRQQRTADPARRSVHVRPDHAQARHDCDLRPVGLDGGDGQQPALRADAEVVLYAADGVAERARFVLSRCIPVKLKAPPLNAKDGGIAIEEFQMAYESLSLKRPPAVPTFPSPGR